MSENKLSEDKSNEETPSENKHWHIVVDLDDKSGQSEAQPTVKPLPKPQSVPTPSQIFEQAKSVILHQDEALRVFCVYMYYHLKLKSEHTTWQVIQEMDQMLGCADVPTPKEPATITKHPIFITGKTGSGKTHLIKTLCQMLDVNFIAVNATHISNAGYKGMTLADIGAMLLEQAKGDLVQAQFSVVFFDEFDKLFISEQGSQLSTYHLSLVTEILTVVEGTTDFPVRDSDSLKSHHMLFILGGSFALHQDKGSPMGFVHDDVIQSVPTNQLGLTKLGLPDELAGRIGQIVSMLPLTHTMLKDILLNSPTSPYHTLQSRLALEDCTAEISDELLTWLLDEQKTAIDKFGVRGLYQGFHELPQVLDILMDAPASRGSHYCLDVAGFVKYPADDDLTSFNTEKTAVYDDEELPF